MLFDSEGRPPPGALHRPRGPAFIAFQTGSEVGVDEGGCSPTRARARCACRSSRSGREQAHRRLPQSRQRRAAGVADHDADRRRCGDAHLWRQARRSQGAGRDLRSPSRGSPGRTWLPMPRFQQRASASMTARPRLLLAQSKRKHSRGAGSRTASLPTQAAELREQRLAHACRPTEQ